MDLHNPPHLLGNCEMPMRCPRKATQHLKSYSQRPVRVEASDIVSPEDARFSDLTNYWVVS